MEILLFLLVFALMINVVGYSLFYGIGPVPTSCKVQKKIFEILPKGIKGDVAELGSGWGTFTCKLACKLPDCQIKAYEISPLPYLFSKALAAWYELPNVQILKRDFFYVSLRETSLVVCYLYPKAMDRLKEKFQNELKPGTYIITHTFAISGWKELCMFNANDIYKTPVYLYRI